MAFKARFDFWGSAYHICPPPNYGTISFDPPDLVIINLTDHNRKIIF
jgi:hypothetical protein